MESQGASCERSLQDLLTDACAISKSSPLLAEWNLEGFSIPWRLAALEIRMRMFCAHCG